MAKDKEADVWAKLQSEFGGAFFRADEKARFSTEGVPFPSLAMGTAIGTFELPFGKIGMLYGAEGSGKSIECMEMVREAQKKYPKSRCVWVDAEGSLNKKLLVQMGVDLSRLMIISTNNGAEIFYTLCGVFNDKTGKKTKPGILDLCIAKEIEVPLIVIDSVASIQPPQEMGRSFESQEISPLPKFINRSLRFCRPMLAKGNTAMMMINHLRVKMDGKGGTYFPGGNTLRHEMDIICKLHASTKAEAQILDDKKEKQGHMLILTCEKTRFGPNRHMAEMWLDFRTGIVKKGEALANVAHAFGVVQRPSTAMWEYGEHKIKGKDNFYKLLDDNPELYNEIWEKVKINKENGIEAELEVDADLRMESDAEDQSIEDEDQAE